MEELVDAIIVAAFANAPDFAVVADRDAIELALIVHGINIDTQDEALAA